MTKCVNFCLWLSASQTFISNVCVFIFHDFNRTMLIQPEPVKVVSHFPSRWATQTKPSWWEEEPHNVADSTRNAVKCVWEDVKSSVVTHHTLSLHWCTVPLLHTPQVETWAHFLNLWPRTLLRPSPCCKGGQWDRRRPCPAWSLVRVLGCGQGGGHCEVLRDWRWAGPCPSAGYRPCAADTLPVRGKWKEILSYMYVNKLTVP